MGNDKNKMKKKSTTEYGYSLIELLVAIGLFATVVAITSGTFVVSLKGHRKTFTAQTVADNVRFSMEIMAKEIRMGTGFTINPGGCGGDNGIQFTSNMPNRSGNTLLFCHSSTNDEITFDDGGGSAASITASNLAVTDLRFDRYPAAGSPYRITTVLEGESKNTSPDVKTSINVQTTISPRVLQ